MREPPRCTALTVTGEPCRASPPPGKARCRWHDPSPAAREKHAAESKRGGLTKAYGALAAVAALADDPRVAALNLETAEGLRGFLAATLGALARLPFDTRTANAISALATAQRNVVEASSIEERLAALEAGAAGPRRVA
ncbi:MAG: hypothetical protein ACYC1W_09680 [Gemmatimonadaceae bacterium]